MVEMYETSFRCESLLRDEKFLSVLDFTLFRLLQLLSELIVTFLSLSVRPSFYNVTTRLWNNRQIRTDFLRECPFVITGTCVCVNEVGMVPFVSVPLHTNVGNSIHFWMLLKYFLCCGFINIVLHTVTCEVRVQYRAINSNNR